MPQIIHMAAISWLYHDTKGALVTPQLLLFSILSRCLYICLNLMSLNKWVTIETDGKKTVSGQGRCYFSSAAVMFTIFHFLFWKIKLQKISLLFNITRKPLLTEKKLRTQYAIKITVFYMSHLSNHIKQTACSNQVLRKM